MYDLFLLLGPDRFVALYIATLVTLFMALFAICFTVNKAIDDMTSRNPEYRKHLNDRT